MFRVHEFIFSRFDNKQWDRGTKRSRNIRNLQYALISESFINIPLYLSRLLLYTNIYDLCF